MVYMGNLHWTPHNQIKREREGETRVRCEAQNHHASTGSATLQQSKPQAVQQLQRWRCKPVAGAERCAAAAGCVTQGNVA